LIDASSVDDDSNVIDVDNDDVGVGNDFYSMET
jgi:hypothetical protein